MTKILLIYLLAISVIAFVAYGFDKLCARRHRRRISEASLIWLAVVGGSLGALLGMWMWRHKTRHLKFTIGVPVILLAQMALALWLLHS